MRDPMSTSSSSVLNSELVREEGRKQKVTFLWGGGWGKNTTRSF